MHRLISILASCLLLITLVEAQAASSLAQIQQTGFIRCGIHSSLPGFSTPLGNGRWQGLEVDICKAVAIALFDNPERVHWQPIVQGEGYAQLQTGDIDILVNHNSWSPTLETTQGLLFTTPTYFTSQGILVNDDDLNSLADLSGATLCAATDTSLPEALAAITIKRLDYSSHSIAGQAFKNQLCQAFLAPTAELYQFSSRQGTPEAYNLLTSFTPIPTGPLVRDHDLELFKLVRLVVHTLLAAEQLAISQDSITDQAAAQTPAFIQLLELSIGGISFGLEPDWATRVIAQLGHYGELFNRHLGEPYGIPRAANGRNQDGGLFWLAPLPKRLPSPTSDATQQETSEKTSTNTHKETREKIKEGTDAET